MGLGHAIGALCNRHGQIRIERAHFRLENRTEIRRASRGARAASSTAGTRERCRCCDRRRIDLGRHRLEIEPLQTTTECVDIGARADLTPESLAKICEHVRHRVNLVPGLGHRFHLDHALETFVGDDAAECARLRITHAIERTIRFDLAKDVFVEQPRRCRERVVEQELERFFLTRGLDVAEHQSLLTNKLLLLVLAADNARDMPHLLRPLTDRAAVNLFEIVVRRSILPRRRRFDELHRALEIFHAQRGRLHGVGIAHRFRLFARVRTTRTSVARKTIPRNRVLHFRPFVERRLFVFGTLRTRDGRIAPHHCVLVVRADLRDKIIERNIVFRLRDVVEARVVHQRRRVPHLFHPRLRTHRICRVHGAGLEVVREAERMSHFVRRDVFDQTAHQ